MALHKLTYWVAPNKEDHKCYNLRARTKKELLAMVKQFGSSYSERQIYKHTITYTDTFNLMAQCLGEMGPCEPYYSEDYYT